MNVSRRWFLGGAASFGALQGCRLAPAFDFSGGPRLKFGVVTDIHIIAENTDRGYQGNTRVFRQALRWFDAQGVDGVVIPGDMADAGLVSQLQCVADAWNEVFPNGRSRLDGRRVERLFIYGNHDFEGYNYGYSIFERPSKDLKEDQIAHVGLARAWEEVFGEPYSSIYRKDVKGFAFVGAHWDPANGSGWGAGPNITSFFRDQSRTLDPRKPFFYFQHPHPKNTCYGEWAWGHDGGLTTHVLSQFRNAVAFSGHSHYSLVDERSFWQGSFTSIGAGSLRYAGSPCDEFAKEGGYEDGGGGTKEAPDEDKLLPPLYAPEARNGLLVSVYDDGILVTRRDFASNTDLGPGWSFTLPGPGAHESGFGARTRSSAASEFAPGAALTFERKIVNTRKRDEKAGKKDAFVTVPAVLITFPAAVQTYARRVWRYEVAVTDAAGRRVLTRRILSPDYHLPFEKRISSVYAPIAEDLLAKAGATTVTVTPFNCFGKAGRPLVGSLATLKLGGERKKV